VTSSVLKLRSSRLLSSASSHGSNLSLNPSSASVNDTNDKKKRKKLLTDLTEFHHIKKNKKRKKNKDLKSKMSSSLSSSSLSTSASSTSMSGLSFTSDDTSTASSVDSNKNDFEVFELCSQSLVFESKKGKILKQKALSEKKFKEINKQLALKLFAPHSYGKKFKSQQPVTKLADINEELRVNKSILNENYIKSPMLAKNSKLIDEILINKEQEQEKEVKKSGRRRLFNASSYDYIEKAFDTPIDDDKKAKKLINNSTSTSKSNETSIPLAQKNSSVNITNEQSKITSFLTSSNSSVVNGNLTDHERYLLVSLDIKKKKKFV
jgi:hypothetical protein